MTFIASAGDDSSGALYAAHRRKLALSAGKSGEPRAPESPQRSRSQSAPDADQTAVRAMEPLQYQYFDIMGGSPVQGGSRWDRGDHEPAIRILDAALEKAGLPGELQPAMRVLDRAEQLVAAGRREREAAQAKLDAASRALLADGDIDAAGYAAVLTECGPWISDDATGSVGLGDAARQVRMRAVMTVFGMVGELYRKLSAGCRDVVASMAGIPDPPSDVWQVQYRGTAGTVMIRHGREADWAKFTRLSEKWDAIHAAGRLLRETGQLQTELLFDGCSTDLGVLFLNWQPAQIGENLQLLPGPLRVRRAVDLGWLPGLWLKSDHDRFAVEQREKPKRKLFAAFAGKSSPDTTSVGDEFSA